MILLPVVLLGFIFFFITLNNVQTEIYDIERFSNANETIRSPITIENEQETERKTRETVQSVQDRYSISNEVTMEQVSFVEEIFDGILKLEEESKGKRNEKKTAAPLTDQEKVIQLKQVLSDEISSSVKDGTLLHLLQFSEDELNTGKEILAEAIEETLNNGVRTENLETAKANVNQHIEYADIEETLREPLMELTDFAVVENSFLMWKKPQKLEKRPQAVLIQL